MFRIKTKLRAKRPQEKSITQHAPSSLPAMPTLASCLLYPFRACRKTVHRARARARQALLSASSRCYYLPTSASPETHSHPPPHTASRSCCRSKKQSPHADSVRMILRNQDFFVICRFRDRLLAARRGLRYRYHTQIEKQSQNMSSGWPE